MNTGADEISDLDRELARLRVLLEKKYGSDDDSGFTYICDDNYKLSLTPLMMREWAMAMVSTSCTIHS